MKVSQLGMSTLLILGTLALLILWLDTADTPIALVLLALVGLLFYKLDIQVSDQSIQFAFGIGLIRRRIPLNQVVRAQVVKNSLWSGWGIRIGPGYTLYNVSGLDAVELTIKGKGQKIRLGTTEPIALSQYINRKVTG